MNKVLIVEDDKVIADGLRLALKAEGYQVSNAYDGEMGLHKIKTEAPDLVILDVMMPNMNGFEVITEVRHLGDKVPVIVLSARNETKDKIRGLDLGADDYMTKPFDLEELLARVRRFLKNETTKKSTFTRFTYNWETRELTDGKKLVILLSKERLLLEFLIKRSGQIVDREQILNAVWGDDYFGTDRTVDNVIMSLRKKIGKEHLRTERGLGYRFVTKL